MCFFINEKTYYLASVSSFTHAPEVIKIRPRSKYYQKKLTANLTNQSKKNYIGVIIIGKSIE